MKRRARNFTAFSAAALLCVDFALAEDNGERQALIDSAQVAVRNFTVDPEMDGLKASIRDARAVLIVPRLLKGGFIVGGSGGDGVLLARGDMRGDWSDPAFYTMGSVTLGLQVGGEVSEVVLLAMTKKGMEAMLSDSFKLGGDASVAAGPVGVGAKAATSDVLAYSRSKGLYGGLNVEGAVISTRDAWNRSYYGQDITPTDILVSRKVHNPQAARLRAAVDDLARLNPVPVR